MVGKLPVIWEVQETLPHNKTTLHKFPYFFLSILTEEKNLQRIIYFLCFFCVDRDGPLHYENKMKKMKRSFRKLSPFHALKSDFLIWLFKHFDWVSLGGVTFELPDFLISLLQNLNCMENHDRASTSHLCLSAWLKRTVEYRRCKTQSSRNLTWVVACRKSFFNTSTQQEREQVFARFV